MIRFKLLASLLFLSVCLCSLAQQNNYTIYFEHDDSKITGSSQATLDSITSKYGIRRNLAVHLHGYCDSTGSYEYNSQLSKKRAYNTYEQLRKPLKSDTYFDYHGHSFTTPKASNKTTDGRAKNRRVEISISNQTEQLKNYKILSDNNLPLSGKAFIFFNDSSTREHKTVFFQNGKLAIPKSEHQKIHHISISSANHFPGLIDNNQTALQLPPLKTGIAVKLKNIGFVPNKAEFLPASYPILTALYQTLQDNEIQIELHGHTNGVKTKKTLEWHDSVSTARAEAVYNYLLDRGIKKWRMTYTGHGCTEMIHPNGTTKEECKLNRRVEVIVKED